MLPTGAPVCFETLDQRMPDGRPMLVHLDTVVELGYFLELADRRMVDGLNAAIDRFAATGELPNF